jgi:hypothetical protein
MRVADPQRDAGRIEFAFELTTAIRQHAAKRRAHALVCAGIAGAAERFLVMPGMGTPGGGFPSTAMLCRGHRQRAESFRRGIDAFRVRSADAGGHTSKARMITGDDKTIDVVGVP